MYTNIEVYIMKITKHILEKAIGNQSIKIFKKYINNSYRIKESRNIQTESDFNSISQFRYSDDNGKTWSEYVENKQYFVKDGEKEILEVEGDIKYNSINNHIIKIVMKRVFLYEHKAVYKNYWDNGIRNWCDYTYIKVSKDNGQTFPYEYKLKYEPEKDIHSNIAYFGNNIEIDKYGNIFIAIVAPTKNCCTLLNIDENNISKSAHLHNSVIVFKGIFNQNTNNYDFSFSLPIVIKDSLSSRGLLEPNIVLLDSGELLLECRGSNVIPNGWKTKMKQNTPSYRWVSYSQDNGKTFTSPIPFTYDNNEKFYSPSSISKIIRQSSTNKLFWIGNINKDIPYGNRPRYPLIICEINQKTKTLIKESCIILDQKEKNDSHLLQLSNFNVYEDRIIKNIHIEYSRLGASDTHKWKGDAIQIILDFS